jgi:serine/threonine-protein phosphatase 2A regulatory subunit A
MCARFNVAKCLGVLSQTLSTQAGGREVARSQILPSLEKLREDSDADVRYFAIKSTETANATLTGDVDMDG